jgi:plastocyanin
MQTARLRGSPIPNTRQIAPFHRHLEIPMFAHIRSLLLLVMVFGICQTGFAKDWVVQVGGTMHTGGGDGYGGYDNPILAFAPTPLTIAAGDSVTFQNLGGAEHNVHADDDSFRCANGCDDQGGNGTPSSAEWTFTRTFNTPGTINYHCDVHASMGMKGSIIVNAAVPPTITLGGYLSGNWYNPAQGGHGFQFEFTNLSTGTNTFSMIAIWFVYTPAASTVNDGSGQNWIYAQGNYDTTKNTVTLPAILQTGARFPPNYSAGDLRRVGTGPNPPNLWGTLTFTFSDCNNGTVSWHSDVPGYNNANDTPLPIQRLTQIAGTACPQ